MPEERVRARRMTAKKIVKPIPAEERPIPADTVEQREKNRRNLYRRPRKPGIRPIPIQESLDRIQDAAKRRAVQLKLYKQSGEKDLDAYTAFWAESDQIDIAREQVRFFISYMINLAGPGITIRSASLRVGVNAKLLMASLKKWEEERIASGKPPLKPLPESYYNYYSYLGED